MSKTFTLADANKHLRMLDDERDTLLAMERAVCQYVCEEDGSENPPAYDYEATRSKVRAIDAKVLTLRHALCVFKATTILHECGLTIDEAQIVLSQLSRERTLLDGMRAVKPRQRVSDRSTDLFAYRCVNYDIAQVERDYESVSERIASLQREVDLANQVFTFEVDL